MNIRRVWAMPDKWTFKIKPIEQLIYKYVGDGKGWIDPFAGENSPAEITNDINLERPATYHLDAFEFSKIILSNRDGVLFDPPYSLHQTIEVYEGMGLKKSVSAIMNKIAPKIKQGGYAISFGWNTNGFGKKHGFKIIEILLVAHGGSHNDTIVTVEQKIQGSLFSE